MCDQVARAQTLLKVVGEPLSSASIGLVYACVCFDLIGHTAPPISYEYDDDGGWVVDDEPISGAHTRSVIA